jgi:hypothetical protein
MLNDIHIEKAFATYIFKIYEMKNMGSRNKTKSETIFT